MVINISSAYMHGLERARRIGAEQAEAFVSESRSICAYVDGDRISVTEERVDRGIGVRILKDNRLGRATANFNGFKEIDTCVHRAMEAGAMSMPDPVFKGFIGPQGPLMFEPDVVSENIDGLFPAHLVEVAMQVVALVNRHGVKVPRAMIRSGSVDTVVGNTNGQEAHHAYSMVYMHFTSMSDEPRPGEGIEQWFSHSLEGFDPEIMGMRLVQKAKAAANAVPYQGRETLTMILPPHNASEMLTTSIGVAMSGEEVNLSRSPWADRLGEQVASRSLTLLEDPTDPRGILSGCFDDEGCSASKRPLVQSGVLKEFMYDNYNATKAGVKPTGNVIKRSTTDPRAIYRGGNKIAPLNLVVIPGGKSVEDVMSSVDRGIYVEQFAWPQADPLTGRFGLEVRCGHMIEGGEVVGTIRNALLSGNMFDAVKDIRGIADDSTVHHNTIVPTMAFGGVDLIGGD